jgi:U32 family peptidase
VRIHASTQINAHNTLTVAELQRLGFSRVTLARELSLPEIGVIAQGAPIEVETFVHGALCFCYSGQCLLSSAVGGRSANRGLSARSRAACPTSCSTRRASSWRHPAATS